MKNQNSKEQELINKIEIGTAQFGLNYGVSNGVKVSFDESRKIVKYLYDEGVYFIDTAPSYGDSEKVLSEIIREKNKIVTKLLPLSRYAPDEIIEGIKSSSNLLKSKLIGFMVHDSSDIFDPDFKYVKEYMDKYLGENYKFGVSLYDPMDLIEITKLIRIDMVQIPYNAIDQRAENEKFKDLVLKHNIEVHVRSVFLQGLLLMNNNIPESLKSVQGYKNILSKEADKLGLTNYEFCIYFVLRQDWVDHMVIGLDNVQQSVDLIQTVRKISGIEISSDYSHLNCNDLNLINPAKWKNEN